jgi:hypothetical protein
MAEATVDTKAQAPEDAAGRVQPEAGQPDGPPNWTMSYERLSGLLQQ